MIWRRISLCRCRCRGADTRGFCDVVVRELELGISIWGNLYILMAGIFYSRYDLLLN